jgi:hypothetical protein
MASSLAVSESVESQSAKRRLGGWCEMAASSSVRELKQREL